MTQGGYRVIIILPIKSKMAATKKQCFLRFLYLTESSPPSFKARGLQMTLNLALVLVHISSRHYILKFCSPFCYLLIVQIRINTSTHTKEKPYLISSYFFQNW